MAEFSPHLYTARGVARGHSQEIVQRSAHAHARIFQSGSFPVVSLAHLARLTGVSYVFLRNIVSRVDDPYTDIVRPKPSGKIREISSPSPVLLEVQRWILQNILADGINHPSSFAYQKGRSIKDCAASHLGAKWIVKFDMHDFFHGIDETRVYREFLRLGFSPLVSLELARVCTRLRGARYRVPSAKREDAQEKYSIIPSYAVGSAGFLPQGAPTSGALANLVASALDRDLAEIAQAEGLVYSRYSDDLTFSAGDSFSRRRAELLIRRVRKMVARHNFVIHEKKTRVIPPGSRAAVLGLLVDGERVRLRPEFRDRLEWQIRGVRKFGIAAHSSYLGFHSVFSFFRHVEGGLAFSWSVDPKYAAKLWEEWREATSEISQKY